MDSILVLDTMDYVGIALPVRGREPAGTRLVARRGCRRLSIAGAVQRFPGILLEAALVASRPGPCSSDPLSNEATGTGAPSRSILRGHLERLEAHHQVIRPERRQYFSFWR